MSARSSLHPGRKIGFAVGDYAINLYWQSISLFLLFYYTEVVGLSGAQAGFIYMVASIFDGVIDPIVGVIADRTRTRWGRYRPYLLIGAVPLALSFCGLYYRPSVQGLDLLAFLLATHLLFRVALTVVGIPYSSLTARLTTNSKERTTLAGLRMMFAALAGLTVSWLTQPLTRTFAHDGSQGFFGAAAVFAAIACAILPIVFLATREPAESDDEHQRRLSARDCWESIRHNRAFWVVILAIVFGAGAATVLSKSLLYYFKYVLHDEAAARYAMSLNAAVGLLFVPAWMAFAHRVGKRMTWLTAVAWGLAGLAAIAVLRPSSVSLTTMLFVFLNAGTLGISLVYWAFLPDTVEYGEWRSGHRAESLIFGLAQFFLKAALGVGAYAFGLAWSYVGVAPGNTSAASTNLLEIIVILPAAGLLISGCAMLANPLRQGVHERIVAELASATHPKQGS